jgi:outer membrane protein
MRKYQFAALLVALSIPLAHGDNLIEVYNTAAGADPRIGQAEALYEARREIVPQTRAQLLPDVSMSGFYDKVDRQFPGATIPDPETGIPVRVPDDDFDQNGWQAELRQPLFDAEAWFGYKSAQSRKEQAKWDYTTATDQLIVRVASAYLDVLRAQDLLEATQAAETAFKRQLEQVQQRFDVGLVAITDVLEAQAAADGAEVDRIQAEGDHDIFFETLRALTGVSYQQIDRLSETLPIVDPEPGNEAEWVQTALASNTGIKAAQEDLLAAQREHSSRRGAHLPTVDVVANYSDFETDSGFTFIGDTKTTTYSLQARLPIYQGGFTQSRVREARYRVVESEERLRDQEWTVTRDVRNLFQASVTDVVRVRARLKAIDSTESAVEAIQTGYEVGTRNIVDVLNAQQRLYASQFDYADSRYRYVLDLLLLKQRSGVLTSEDLVDLNKFTDPNDPVLRIVR